MKLDVRNKHQKDVCRIAKVYLDGKEQQHCIVANSDEHYVELKIGERRVGLARKDVLMRVEGHVVIKVDDKEV